MSVYQSFVLHLCLSVYKSFVLHLDVSAYKSPVYAISGGAQFTKLFLFISVFFKKKVCVEQVSKHRNKPKNKFLGFMKHTEKQPKQIVFRFFQFKPKIFLVCLEDTLLSAILQH
jgi:hypothetical protein